MNKLKLDLHEPARFQGPGNNPFWHGLLTQLSSPQFQAVQETLAAYFSPSLAPTLPSKPCRVTLALIDKSLIVANHRCAADVGGLFKGYGAL